jgi:DNA-directed RNA polymerase
MLPILNDSEKNKLPEVPEKGDFDIEEVLKSEFFFA